MALIQFLLPEKCVKLSQCQKDKLLLPLHAVTFTPAFSNMD